MTSTLRHPRATAAPPEREASAARARCVLRSHADGVSRRRPHEVLSSWMSRSSMQHASRVAHRSGHAPRLATITVTRHPLRGRAPPSVRNHPEGWTRPSGHARLVLTFFRVLFDCQRRSPSSRGTMDGSVKAEQMREGTGRAGRLERRGAASVRKLTSVLPSARDGRAP